MLLNFEAVKLWNFETLNLWIFETLKLWNFETLKLWNFKKLNFWNFETFDVQLKEVPPPLNIPNPATAPAHPLGDTNVSQFLAVFGHLSLWFSYDFPSL